MFNLSFTLRLISATILGLGLLAQLEQTSAVAQIDISSEESQSSFLRISQDDWSFWPSNQEQRAPRRTSSGSTRHPTCNSEELVPLTPPDEVGLTRQARPEILFYVPEYMPRQAVFRIHSHDNFTHTAPVSIPETAGIIRLPLPEEIPNLPAGQRYLWSLMFLCGEQAGPNSPTVSGWLETQARLEPIQSSVTPSLAQAAQYRNNALWYDMVAMLANLKLGNPDDTSVDQAWRIVLDRHQLTGLSDEPIAR